ncbi:MAG: hypothetical protein AB7P35_17855 [Hyphomonadaceae bacterium]
MRVRAVPFPAQVSLSDLLERHAAHARAVRLAHGQALSPAAKRALLEAEHALETEAALIDAEALLAGAEVA